MSNALPRKWHRWLRIALTALTSCVLSAGIEYAQYRFALGMAETDDVICNTLGAVSYTHLMRVPGNEQADTVLIGNDFQIGGINNLHRIGKIGHQVGDVEAVLRNGLRNALDLSLIHI